MRAEEMARKKEKGINKNSWNNLLIYESKSVKLCFKTIFKTQNQNGKLAK